MSSNRSSSGPSTSATTSSQQNVSSSSAKPKLIVEVHIAGKIEGDAAARFSTRVGELIRTHIPKSYKEWRLVPVNFKDDVWNALMGEFSLTVDPAVCREIIEVSFPPYYRRFKYEVRQTLKRIVKALRQAEKASLRVEQAIKEGVEIPEAEEEDEDEALPELTPEIWESVRADVPPGINGINPNIWEEFVDMEKNPEKIAKNKVNAESKAKNTIHHTLGRCTYHNKKHKLDEMSEKVVPPSTIEKWLYGHLRRDGTVHPSALEVHGKVSGAVERNKGKGDQSSSSNVVSAELEEVFGRKRSGGIRGYSSHMSKKQVGMAAIAHYALQQRDNENALKLNKIEADVGFMGGKLIGIEGEYGSLGSALKEMLNCMKRKTPTSPSRVGTPSPEKGSNSHLGHQLDQSLDHADSVTNEPPSLHVQLLDNRRRVVASGCIIAGDYVHCRKVKPLEKKVYVKEVHDQSALVCDGPQGDDVNFFKDLELSTFLIWSEDRLRFVPVKLVGVHEGELPIHGTFQVQFYSIQVYNQDIMISHN
ncbi:uncharacterized protein LOC113295804 isoform X2 [Papaver somniferum]|nr:uncharacterized protein LOC113295804 isoform X2 [Papaver somniferum]